MYKEQLEAQDLAQLDKLAEEASVPGESQDPFTEDQKNQAMKKARFVHLTKTFYDPEGFLLHQKQLDRDRARATASGGADRVGTPNSGVHPDQADDGKYHPLTPE